MGEPVQIETAVARALLTRLIGSAAAAKASDLHLRADAPPFVRVDGVLTKTNGPPATAQEIEQVIFLTSGRDPERVGTLDWEYSFDQVGGTRYRGHVFRESGRWALSIRIIPANIPSFQELRLPPVAKVLAEKQPGLVLITGPTGSGKTTTAAAMLRAIAAAETSHIVTIEDPIEYRIIEAGSCVSQREVGRDTASLAAGLRAAMREDPDVLFIGEIRDRESLEVAMQAAETGHVVLSTFHTATASQTLLRLVALYPSEEQVSARERLADCLRGAICQRLLPRKRSRGRVLCTEVLVNNYAVRECIRDVARVKGLNAVLERSANQHMHTLDQDLSALVRDGLIEAEVAIGCATAPADLRRSLNMNGLVA